jgi:nucleoid-associated protein YgaU
MFAKLVVIVAVLTVAVAWGARGSDGAGSQHGDYVVRAGDTLWSIAAARYGGDPRDGVWKLQDRNHLAGALVHPGQRLVLP